MEKLFHIVAFNLDKARRARDGIKPRKANSMPETLVPGDNMLVRDHTSKAFQPKYKDFCVTGLVGKNQVKVKDNHGHTTKVHHRDVKKTQMVNKISDLYREEQDDKVRNSRKILSLEKTPDLQWKLIENPEIGEIIRTPPGPTAISIIMIITLIIQFCGDLFQKNKRTITKYYQKTQKLIGRTTGVTRHSLCHNNMRNMYDFCK